MLAESERHELAALSASIYVKEQLVSRKFLNQTRIPMATNLPTKWSLSVSVGEENVEMDIKYVKGKFEVGKKLVGNSIKIFHFGWYIIRYTVGNLV